ncbi:hypothetical protein C8Q79DRAFT_244589 [Trametes meyenii]|nr:hypothetical protein C8Q79DRAFT_244589 [Trametes meyenii]
MDYEDPQLSVSISIKLLVPSASSTNTRPRAVNVNTPYVSPPVVLCCKQIRLRSACTCPCGGVDGELLRSAQRHNDTILMDLQTRGIADGSYFYRHCHTALTSSARPAGRIRRPRSWLPRYALASCVHRSSHPFDDDVNYEHQGKPSPLADELRAPLHRKSVFSHVRVGHLLLRPNGICAASTPPYMPLVRASGRNHGFHLRIRFRRSRRPCSRA